MKRAKTQFYTDLIVDNIIKFLLLNKNTFNTLVYCYRWYTIVLILKIQIGIYEKI